METQINCTAVLNLPGSLKQKSFAVALKHSGLTDDVGGLCVVSEFLLVFIFTVLAERALVTGF